MFRSEQCPNGLQYLLNLFKGLNPKVYMEVGCAQLGTLLRFKENMDNGLCIGVDARDYPEWDEVDSKSSDSGIRLSSQGLHPKKVIVWLKRVLKGQQIDFLFIDGDHSIEGVTSDWESFSPFVRSGGIVAFHDYDPFAIAQNKKEGQGAAWTCKKLEEQQYSIQIVPNTSIGIAYVEKK